ncbi:MFS transporter [Pseudochelatococcus sp. B33]
MRGLYRGWLIVGLAFMVMTVVFGARFTLGLFVPGLTQDLNASVTSVSLVFALATLLSGFTQPVIGVFADRFGPAIVMHVGLVAMGLAYVGTGFATEMWQVMLLMGVMSGIAFSGVNLVILSTLISRWFRRKRGTALGIVTSGSKVGTFVVMPAAGAAIVAVGWRETLLMLGASMLVLVPLMWRYLRSNPQDIGLHPDGDPMPAPAPVPVGTPLATPAGSGVFEIARRAVVTPAFWLITVSLFGNGFLMNLVYFHLPSAILHLGHSQLVATGVLALMGAIGIFGNILSGTLSDYMSRKHVLAVLYIARSAATLLIVAQPELWQIYLFAAIFGFLGYGAVALTSNITGDVFGAGSLATIFGLIYVLHQVGGALGTYAGGLSVDLTGSYAAAFWMCAVISAISTVVTLLIPVRPLSLECVTSKQ